MVIDKGKLIALLADKTGTSNDEVEQQLGELTNRIQEATESNRQFNIEGFGTFSKVDDEIHFEPAQKLQTEINQKYAGMAPIELMEPFKESGAGIPVEETETPPPVTEDVFEEPEFVKEEQEPGEEEVEDTEDMPEEAPVPVAEEQAKPKQQPLVEDPAIEEEPPAEQIEKEEKQESESEEEEAVAASIESGMDTVGSILMAAVVLIVLAAGAWWFYGTDFGSSTTNNQTAVPADTTQNETEPIADNAVENDSLMSSTEQENTADADSVNQSSPTAPYGLRGSYNDEATEGYTLVIHSFYQRATVQNIADSLQQQNYRTVLFAGEVNDQTRWRLGLGQFQTVNAAQQAAQKLTEPYRENHFIKRYNK